MEVPTHSGPGCQLPKAEEQGLHAFTYPFLVQCEIIRRESEELCSDPSSASTKLGELRQVTKSLCVSGYFTCQIYLSDGTYWIKSQALGQTPMCDFSGLTTRDYKSSACQSSRGKPTSPPQNGVTVKNPPPPPPPPPCSYTHLRSSPGSSVWRPLYQGGLDRALPQETLPKPPSRGWEEET